MKPNRRPCISSLPRCALRSVTAGLNMVADWHQMGGFALIYGVNATNKVKQHTHTANLHFSRASRYMTLCCSQHHHHITRPQLPVVTRTSTTAALVGPLCEFSLGFDDVRHKYFEHFDRALARPCLPHHHQLLIILLPPPCYHQNADIADTSTSTIC